jgi:hypothetical protein
MSENAVRVDADELTPALRARAQSEVYAGLAVHVLADFISNVARGANLVQYVPTEIPQNLRNGIVQVVANNFGTADIESNLNTMIEGYVKKICESCEVARQQLVWLFVSIALTIVVQLFIALRNNFSTVVLLVVLVAPLKWMIELPSRLNCSLFALALLRRTIPLLFGLQLLYEGVCVSTTSEKAGSSEVVIGTVYPLSRNDISTTSEQAGPSRNALAVSGIILLAMQLHPFQRLLVKKCGVKMLRYVELLIRVGFVTNQLMCYDGKFQSWAQIMCALRLGLLIHLDFTIRNFWNKDIFLGATYMTVTNKSFQAWCLRETSMPTLRAVYEFWLKFNEIIEKDIPSVSSIKRVLWGRAIFACGSTFACVYWSFSQPKPLPNVTFSCALLSFLLAVWDAWHHMHNISLDDSYRVNFFTMLACREDMKLTLQGPFDRVSSYIRESHSRFHELCRQYHQTNGENDELLCMLSDYTDNDRIVTIAGNCSTGKSSLMKAMLLENQIQRTTADGTSGQNAQQFAALDQNAQQFAALNKIQVGEKAGTTTGLVTSPFEIGLRAFRRNQGDDARKAILVDTPGLGLELDIAGIEGGVVTAETVKRILDINFPRTDVFILVMNVDDNEQFYNLYFVLLEQLRRKHGLEENGERWRNAWKRIIIVKTKADSIMSPFNDGQCQGWPLERQYQAYRKNGQISFGFRRIDDLFDTISQRLTDQLNVRNGIHVEVEEMKAQILPVGCKSMGFEDPEERGMVALVEDFGVKELLKNIRSVLQNEDLGILSDAVNNRRGVLSRAEAALVNAQHNSRWRTVATTGVAAVATGVACVFIPPVGMALGALATGTVSVGTVFVSWPIWKNVENIDAIQNDIKKAKRELNEAEQRRHENIPHETHAENIT